ncbi:MAG: hypothetical protein ACLGH8_11900 [Bacteroidia bacterium]
MTSQEILLKHIRQKLGKDTSVIDAIATVLQISYDAAHRRVALKSRFSIDETVALSRYFGLSMDALFKDEKIVLAQKTPEILTMADMERYMAQSAENVARLTEGGAASVYYSAKDLPLFYTVGGTLLSKFKLYVWLNLLSGNNHWEPFEKFTVSTPLLQHGEALKKAYNKADVHEIWNETTVNSSLQQVYYHFSSGLLSTENAVAILNDVSDILTRCEQRCTTDNRYNMYYNELLILNNNVLITSADNQALFVPYTMLGHFITSDADTCANTMAFFTSQMKNSVCLNSSGTRDRKGFFNKIHSKISRYKQMLADKTEFGL